MKSCPTCHSQYTDDSLRFCLQDGTPLLEPTAAPTVAFSDQETVVATRPTSPAAHPTTPVIVAPEPARSKLLIFAVIFLGLALLAFAGIGVWVLYTGGSPYSRTNPMLANANTERPGPVSKPRPETAANKSAATPAPTTTADAAKIRTEVTERIESWRAGLESVDLDAFMSNYAESVDYYNGRGTTRAAVRDDKSRAFVKFTSMKVIISNITVTPGTGDSRAVAVFDKEWDFSNSDGDRNTGKVSQQLVLEKIDGKWLIVLEKDLKVIRRPTS